MHYYIWNKFRIRLFIPDKDRIPDKPFPDYSVVFLTDTCIGIIKRSGARKFRIKLMPVRLFASGDRKFFTDKYIFDPESTKYGRLF